MSFLFRRRNLAIVSLFILAIDAHAGEIRSGLADQKNVAVTIYNSGLALIKEQRTLDLPAGIIDLALRDVSGRIRPETATLHSLTRNHSINVLEQNFDFDLLTPDALLKKYVGREVSVVRTLPTTGKETVEKAVVLSAANGVVLKIGNHIETGVPGRLVFGSVPENLRDRPTLVTKLDNKLAGTQTIELSYLSYGLSWKADYVAELDANDKYMSLRGLVTLTNQSGTTYNNALLQLVAGNVHRVYSETGRLSNVPMDALQSGLLKEKKQMQESSLFEYHLYTLPRRTTIRENQTKQVDMLSSDQLKVEKELVLNGSDYYYRSRTPVFATHYKVASMLNFTNKKVNGLGKPLPAGTIRVYKRDGDGRAQFVGEDSIDHTPTNETIRLHLGDSFDVTAEHRQIDWRKANAKGKYSWAAESAYEIKIKNAKKKPATVTVREPIPGDWKILKESAKHLKEDAHTVVWHVRVPAEGSTTLTYRALTRF